MEPVKTVAALHDLSGLGRCALTVAIPVISAMGVQVAPAPTAVLSAHTAFPDFVAEDLTDFLDASLTKWSQMGMRFDCIYTGYMASVRQEELARRFMESQPQALTVVDPVLGDDGRMYRALPADMPQAMRRLCAAADVITPNLTEAGLLTGVNLYGNARADGVIGANQTHPVLSVAQLKEILERLMDLGPKTVLLTGAVLEDGFVNAWMHRDGVVHTCGYTPVPACFPGTGDLFASVLTGALTRGSDFEAAVRLATDYVCETMKATLECGSEPLHGVQLEKTLGRLIPRD